MSTNPSDTAGPDRSPLDIAERAFQMLACAPSRLAVDGREVGYGLPRRPMSLIELRDVLIHPSRANRAGAASGR
ncbi:hypothetical protein ACQPZZ_00085 [Microbispora sp. CA-135349]|uniref:hypothetical protein n=1 Tax=Microbispora sp. CA-135349 TaxID=3239953 RepID=UPI003D9105FF